MTLHPGVNTNRNEQPALVACGSIPHCRRLPHNPYQNQNRQVGAQQRIEFLCMTCWPRYPEYSINKTLLELGVTNGSHPLAVRTMTGDSSKDWPYTRRGGVRTGECPRHPELELLLLGGREGQNK
jgi:hypothetical protein